MNMYHTSEGTLFAQIILFSEFIFCVNFPPVASCFKLHIISYRNWQRTSPPADICLDYLLYFRVGEIAACKELCGSYGFWSIASLYKESFYTHINLCEYSCENFLTNWRSFLTIALTSVTRSSYEFQFYLWVWMLMVLVCSVEQHLNNF